MTKNALCLCSLETLCVWMAPQGRPHRAGHATQGYTVMLYWAMGLAIKKITTWASKVSFQLHAFRLHDHRSAPLVLFADLYL